MHAPALVAAFAGGQDDVGGEHLLGIHRVKLIQLVAKITMHFDLATLCDDVLNLFTAQHTQHGGHPVARTTAMKRYWLTVEQPDVFFVEQSLQQDLGG